MYIFVSGVLNKFASVSSLWSCFSDSYHRPGGGGGGPFMITRGLSCEIALDLLIYCKSTNFGVLLYLGNWVFLLIFAASLYVDRTLHRQAAGRHQI